MEDKNRMKGAERIQREKASARCEAELRYSAVFEQSPDGILIIDAEGKILDFNKAAHTDLGYTREEFEKFSISDIDPLESPAEIRSHIQKTMGEKRAEFEVTHRTKSGEIRNVLVITQAIVLSGRTVMHAIWRDITEQKAAIRKVRYLASILEHVPDAVCSVDTEGRIVSWNEGAERMLGYKADEIIGRTLQSIIPEEKAREEMEHCIGELNKREVFTGHETVRVAKDGRRVPVEISGLALRDGQKITGYASIMRNITERLSIEKVRLQHIAERRAAEENLQRANQILRAITRYSPLAIISTDLDTNVLTWNPAAERIFGWTEAEVLGSKNPIVPRDKQGEYESLRGKVQKGVPYLSREMLRQKKDGTLIYLNASSASLQSDDDRVIGLLGIFEDITQRKNTEKTLKESEQDLRLLFDSSTDGIFILDMQGHFIDANRTAYERLGYAKEEMLSMKINELDPPEFASRVPERLAQIREYGQAVFESAHIKKDGSRMSVEVNSRILDYKGMKVYFSVVRDITERRQAEEELRMREKQLAESQRIAHIGSWEHNLTTGQVFWSDELFRILGLDPEKDPADFRIFFDMIHPDDRPALKKAIDETVRTGKHFRIDYRFMLRDGRTRILHAQAELRYDETGAEAILSGTVQDITESKNTEEAKDRLLKAISTVTEGIAITDDQDKFIYINDAHARIYDCRPEELIGKTWRDTVPPELIPLFEIDLSKNLHNRAVGIWSGECPALRKDGTILAVEITATSRWDETGIYLGHICIVRDISEKKHAEEVLIGKEQFIRNILDTVDEGFIVVDRDFRILTANRAYCRQVGESDVSVIGRHCYEISHKTLRPCHDEGEECAVRHVFETGEPHTALHKHPDAKGSILYVETKAFPIKDSTGAVTSVIETVNNITEKHLLEEEQLKTQKLEAIGTLAGGIAHDFNNLLQGVFGYISMAKMTLAQKERALAMLEQAEKALHMSVDLTTQLLTFSKGGKPVKKKIQLKSVVENSVKFALSGSSVDYRIRFDQDLWVVDADEGQIGQVIQNIVLNADQAMPAGGTIVIAARNVSAPVKGLSTLLAYGKYVEISVKDSGIGIPQKYISRLFDPYFTTKEKGSGLGLATSYSIVKNHGGLIDVKSQSGKGSTFFVYLPAIEAGEERFMAFPATAEAARKGRVLVMDDEELVRNIVGIMLKTLGHEVEFAENGEEAAAKYREAMLSDRRFDIVILDLTIRGGMGGEETLRELLALDPEVKAVVSSGYADSATISEYASRGFSACLTKPYEVNALRNVLNLLLK